MRFASRDLLAPILVFVAAAGVAPCLAAPSSDITADIDAAVNRVLDETGVPSASVAVIRDGSVILDRAYGLAKIDPATPATPSMRYPIGSISKQFIAAVVVMLANEGKLGLDDPIARYFPELTGADEITLRRLLSHTSGVRDYWPQDYVPPAMLEPITTEELIGRWARQPLDFEPGEQYQYSNTGYAIAGAIVEKVSGKPLMDVLRQRIFAPLKMTTVLDIDREDLTPEDATGYQRFGPGPPRLAPDEGKGWLFAAASLAMTAADLAKWNLSLIEGGSPGPEVFREMTREVLLNDGAGTRYGLGVGVALEGSRRVLRHGGEVSGFTAANRVWPDDRAAVVVLVNQDAAGGASAIADRIARLLFVRESPADAAALARAREILEGLRRGEIERSWFTANANHYFSQTALDDMRDGLRKLGKPRKLEQIGSSSRRGGLTTRGYRAEFKKHKTLRIVTRTAEDGRLEQYTLSAE